MVYFNKTRGLACTCVIAFIWLFQACGSSYLGTKPPVIARGASLDSEAGRTVEFERVVRAIGNLELSNLSEKGAAIIVASQIATMKTQQENGGSDGLLPTGRCLLLYSGPEGLFDQNALGPEDFGLSKTGNMAYTKRDDFTSAECQSVFSASAKNVLSGALEQWYVSFYQTSYP